MGQKACHFETCREVCLKVGVCNFHYSNRGAQLHPRSAGATRSAPRELDFSRADKNKWEFPEVHYGGKYSFVGDHPEFEEHDGLISEGIGKLKEHPEAYMAIVYQTNMTSWPEDQQKYKLMQRSTTKVSVQEDPKGAFTYCASKYCALPADVSIKPDAYTDSVLALYKALFGNQKLGTVSPGRGQGYNDVPTISIATEIDPYDVNQQSVGDCWLLSAISTLAEFDGTIQKLFRKTKDIKNLPADKFNKYTVTLWALPKWQEVDIVIDERLCTTPDGQKLLGATPSISGEMWACYLEKAVAAHCGGWDKIKGGEPTHAWRLLTGCSEQYTIETADRAGIHVFKCFACYEEEKLCNSPKDCPKQIVRCHWPEAGGGGNEDLDMDELWERMCAWEDHNFPMAAGTQAGSNDRHKDGVVDGHAYTVLRIVDKAGGTDVHLIQVRNPWGHGELTSGKWDDDGPGWEEHPEVTQVINPVQADDGAFWLEKEEFFKYFPTLYLCAHDMRDFCKQ